MTSLSNSTDADRRIHSATGTSVCLFFFLLGMGAMLLYLNLVTPDPRSYWNNQFFYFVEGIEGPETSPEAYTLVFGSSMTRFNFGAEAFEQALNAHDVEIRAYNMGISGAGAFEVDYYLRRTLGYLERNDIPFPRYVLIDLRFPFTGSTLRKERETRRFVDWHTLRNTLGALELLALEPSKSRRNFEEAVVHVRAMLAHYIPFGQIHRALGASSGNSSFTGSLTPGENEKTTGQRPNPPSVRTPRDRSATRVIFENRVEKRIEFLDSAEPIQPTGEPALRRQIAYLLRKGLIPIYFLPPGFGDSRFVRDLESQGRVPWLAVYDHPAEYPEFWRFSDRADMPHLQFGETSERFTRELANDVHDHVLVNAESYLEGLRTGLRKWDSRGNGE